MSPTIDDLTIDPHTWWHRLRANGPVAWVDALDGWVVLSRELCTAVMRDAVRFTVDDPRFATALVVGPSMLSLDGPEHTRHREPFAHGLRPSDVARDHAPWMAGAAAGLVATLSPGAELRTELAGPWSVAVMIRVLGLDPSRVSGSQLLGWYRAIVAATEAACAGVPVSAPALDAMASLAAAAGIPPFVGPHRLSATEIASNTAVFLFGGIETTEAMIANALWYLLTVPDVLDAVRRDRRLLDAVLDESLRLEPAATRVDRYATVDVELAGAHIRRGDLVMVNLAAAGRDPAVFGDPHRFDLGRVNTNRHVAFATGPHACIGMHLARTEAVVAIGALLDAHPGLSLDPTGSDAPTGLVFRKPARLTARW
jgi:cytochrome P450